MSAETVATVQSIYEAFGRGDVAAILAHVTDDVDWASEADSKSAPWHGIHRGPAEVPQFFKELDAAVAVTEFTPLAFATNDSDTSDVMVVIRFGMRVRSNGRAGTMDIHHWWQFREGKVCRYRGTEDTELTAALLSD